MDPKQPSHLDEPPADTSSEEMEEVSSEEEVEEEDPSEDEEEEEAEQNGAKIPNPQPSESGDDSSSDEKNLFESQWSEDDEIVMHPETPAPKTNGFSSYGAADVDSSLMCDGLTHLPKNVVSRGLDLLPEDKKAELLVEWEKIQLAEMEIFARKSKLMSEQAKLISEALKHGY